tara:strand:- start:494 stop:646 length:153 start_codon:yes stop_codon:yes gene_type:complete
VQQQRLEQLHRVAAEELIEERADAHAHLLIAQVHPTVLILWPRERHRGPQ